MSRLQQIYKPLSYMENVLYGNGQVVNNPRSQSVLLQTLERADIVKNRRSDDGWRAQSLYWVTDSNSIPLMGSALYREVVAGNPQNNITITRSGWLGLDGGALNIPGNPSWYTGPELNDQYPSSNLIRRLETTALLKARDQKVNIGLNLAEMHKTIDMIAGSVTQLFRSYSALRKGNIPGAFKALGVTQKRALKGKVASDRWLEMQYGWLPTLSDIHGGYEEITRPFRKHGIRFKVLTIGKEEDRKELYYPGDAYAPRPNVFFESQTLSRAKVVLWYEVQNEQLLVASAVGLTNPFEIAWELVPFSFLVDWLVPVGNVLGALTADSGLHFMGGTLTRTALTVGEMSLTNPPDKVVNNGRTTVSLTVSGRKTTRQFRMRRTVYATPPFGQFYWKNPFSTGHALNALALLRSIF